MDKKIAFIFPGQGAQSVGMGKDFAAHYPTARQTFEEADDLLSFSLSKLAFEGPADELILTKHCQAAIYVTSIAILRVVLEQCPALKPAFCAGLSLGEYSALTAAGTLDFADGLPLVRARGTWMQEACDTNPGTMLVALGATPEEMEGYLKELPAKTQVWIANLNCPGQIVLAGTHEGIGLATDHLKSKGLKRVLPLDVAGAFHSPLMEPARQKLEPMLQDVALTKSEIDIVMNVVGQPVRDLNEVRSNLTRQVTSSVLWERGVRTMDEKGVMLFIEMGPGKTLTGMNKRIGVNGKTINIEKIEDLEKVGEIETYATT